MATVSAGDAIRAGMRFMGPGANGAAASVGLYAAVVILTALFAPMATSPLAPALVGIIRLPFMVVAAGALLRLALGSAMAPDSGPVGPAGLQWSPLEWRLTGAQILVALIYGVLFFVLIILIAVVIGVLVGTHVLPTITPAQVTPAAMRSLMTGPFGVAIVLMGLPALAAFIYIALRLSLTAVATGVEGRIGIARSWALAGGILWPLLAVALVGALLAVGAGAIGGFLGGIAGAFGGGSARRFGAAFGGGLGGVVSLIFSIGAVSQVYLAKTGAGVKGGANLDEVFS